MQENIYIELKNVNVSGVDTLKRAESIKAMVFRRSEFSESIRIPILRDINLSIKNGEKVGFVGRNGSGKSSLLKVIAGIYKPQTGEVKISGRVAPLIEMGLGFENEFTGRQNIKIGLLYSGRLDSYNKAIEDMIIDFSGLGEKIDAPFKSYSSGMRARLSFSVAVFQKPDILLLDEAFAAGDAEFIHKSYDLMAKQFKNVPIAILVSHGQSMIEDLCTRCIWIDNGRIQADGAPKDILKLYLKNNYVN